MGSRACFSSVSILALGLASSACSKGAAEPETSADEAGSGTGMGAGSGATDGMPGTSGTGGGRSLGGDDGEPVDVGTGGNGSTDSRPPPPPGTVSPAGCTASAGFYGEKSFSAELPGPGGQTITRTYEVRAPEQADFEANKKLPVVMVFHGANGSPSFENLHMAADNAAGRETIYVAAQGVRLPGYEDYGFGWNEACDGYDMPFVDAMLRRVSEELCVDPEMIFAAGYSWGGDMSSSLGCCRGDVFRGVMPAASGERNTDYSGPCTEVTSAFLTSYGEKDGAYAQSAFQDILGHFQAEHGCSADFTSGPELSPTGEEGACKTFEGCAAPVIECVYPNLGHSIPEGWRDSVWNFINSFRP